MSSDAQNWYKVANVAEVESPGLLFYFERIEENVRRMIKMAGGPERLRPHLKTHKTKELLQMQMEEGLRKFKCATIAEAELAGSAGVPDLLLAYQAVGPNLQRLLQLMQRFPKTRFSGLFDDDQAMQQMSEAAVARGLRLPVYLDVDVGQHRSGIAPGREAADLYVAAAKLAGLVVEGLHAYDGHIVDTDLVERKRKCEDAFASVTGLAER